MCEEAGSSQPDLMADVYVKMAGDVEARRRRIGMHRLAVSATEDKPQGGEMRRETFDLPGVGREKRGRTSGDDEDAPLRSPAPPLPPASSSSSSSSGSSSSSFSSSGDGRKREAPVIASTSGSGTAVAESPVVFGSVSLTGRAREMEDAISVRPGFFRPEGGVPLHFFAVFDGHGGSHVSSLCKYRMHVILAEELGRTWQSTAEEAMPQVPEDSRKLSAKQVEEARLRSAVERSFALMDEVALAACACGRVRFPLCACERSGIESEIVGSTAVVSLVGSRRVLVANCGDSRAVLSRAGRAVPLSYDHKPDRPDEQSRIEAAGGRVIYLNGARVYGILAMSRALGDKYLKPFVISEPEICSMERTSEDECLIIASDGLWDVLSNDLACDITRRCLAEADPTSGTLDAEAAALERTAAEQAEEHASDARCSLAAKLLARLALGRRSADNISVIVIDLRQKQMDRAR